MKKPNRFTIYITDPRGIKSTEETTVLNTTYCLFLEQKGIMFKFGKILGIKLGKDYIEL